MDLRFLSSQISSDIAYQNSPSASGHTYMLSAFISKAGAIYEQHGYTHIKRLVCSADASTP